MANSTADGSVVIDVNMDVSQAEKRLAKLRGDIIAVQCLNKKDEDCKPAADLSIIDMKGGTKYPYDPGRGENRTIPAKRLAA